MIQCRRCGSSAPIILSSDQVQAIIGPRYILFQFFVFIYKFSDNGGPCSVCNIDISPEPIGVHSDRKNQMEIKTHGATLSCGHRQCYICLDSSYRTRFTIYFD